VSSTTDLRPFLRTLDAETLVELLCRQTERDPELRKTLEAKASASGGDLAEAHRLLDTAAVGGNIEYSAKVGSVLDTLQRLLDAGSRADLAPLARRTVDDISRVLELIDDSSGEVYDRLERAVQLYARACAAHPPNAERLADWILGIEFDGPGWPEIVLGDFAEALGDKGLARIRSTVDKVLAEDGEGARHETAQWLLEELAEVSGDVDAVVAMLSAKPPRLDISLKIVRVLRGAGRHGEAIAHAGKALAHDKGPLRAPVVEALAETYQEAGQGDEAFTLRRNEFERKPTVAAYLALREAATEVGQWPAQRKAAQALLRKHSADDPSVADELVRVLLAEDRPDEAWRVSTRYGGSLELRLELAELREEDHPVEVIPVYKIHVDHLIAHKDPYYYREAAKQLRKLRTLHRRTDTAEEFSSYLANLVETHKRKTRLLAEVRAARIALPKVARA
jgi:tetratricopeptide (TPR) repeat protein